MNINVKNEFYTINNGNKTEDVSFNFYTDLKASDKLKFVNDVTNLIVDEKSYSSIIKDMIFDFEIINIFTDVDLSDIIEAPNNIDEIEEFLNNTNIVEIVVKNAKDGLIESLKDSVDDNISYKTGVHKNSLANAFTSLLNVIENQIKIIDINKLMSMAETISSLTDDITPEKILDAYANTDMFKENVEARKQLKNENDSKIVELANIIEKSQVKKKGD